MSQGGQVQGVQNAQGQEGNQIYKQVTNIIRMLVVTYAIRTFIGKYFVPSEKPQVQQQGVISAPLDQPQYQPLPNPVYKPKYQTNRDSLDYYFYMNDQAYVGSLYESQPIQIYYDVPYGNFEPKHFSYDYAIPESVQSNGSLYMHMYVTKAGFPIYPNEDDFIPEYRTTYTQQISKYLKEKQKPKGKSLIKQDSSEIENQDAPVPNVTTIIKSFLPANLTIEVVADAGALPLSSIPETMAKFYNIDPIMQEFNPIVWINDFWVLREQMYILNETLDSVTFHFKFEKASFMYFSSITQFDEAFNQQAAMSLQGPEEKEEIKRIFIEGNPYFLGLTMLVSLFHSVFEFLAFRSDISFWNKNKSMEGLSAKTIIIQSFSQVIIFLYLLSEETSWVILIGQGMQTLIELWKITKAVEVKFYIENGIPKVSFKDKISYVSSKTKEYDNQVYQYMSYFLFPCLAIYSGYSLLYQKHKSWISWILNTAVGFVYGFGFILLCPQLYLNYKFKSVAHMPWKFMTFKFLTTIIDDLFAFVIKMPLLHRIAVFRDDVVFVIYIYQRWKYPVDKTRANEFGFSGSDIDKTVEQKQDQSAIDQKQGQLAIEQSKKQGQNQTKESKTIEPKNVNETKKDL